MMLSLGYLIVFGMLGATLFRLIKLPGLLGMILAGMLIGPNGLNLLDETLLAISGDLRKIALIIILLRAGLGLNRKAIKEVGWTAVTMSVIPVIFEGFTIMILAMLIWDFSLVQGGMLGFVIAAVSPAIIVPSMLGFIHKKIGMKKNLPILVLASASIDDIIAITIFTMFMSVFMSQHVNIIAQIVSIPVSIALGIIIGILIGLVLVMLFNKHHIRDSNKVILILAISVLMVSFSEAIESFIMIASLLGVMTLGLVLVERKQVLAERLSIKFDKVWVFAELFLFVLVGAAVDVSIAAQVGLMGLLVIFIGLLARTIGVLIATFNTDYIMREKVFLAISFFPKATVQAAMGAIPLSLKVPNGEIILAMAVLSILVTAPIGAVGIERLTPWLLKHIDESVG